jgi:citrate lyase subunit beta/citryl-CoA lyase
MWANRIVKVYDASIKKGKGATVIDGKMIDEVHYKRAKELLKISK